jgi:hypothetical protein
MAFADADSSLPVKWYPQLGQAVTTPTMLVPFRHSARGWFDGSQLGRPPSNGDRCHLGPRENMTVTPRSDVVGSREAPKRPIVNTVPTGLPSNARTAVVFDSREHPTRAVPPQPRQRTCQLGAEAVETRWIFSSSHGRVVFATECNSTQTQEPAWPSRGWTRWSPRVRCRTPLAVPLAVAGRIRYAERARAGS